MSYITITTTPMKEEGKENTYTIRRLSQTKRSELGINTNVYYRYAMGDVLFRDMGCVREYLIGQLGQRIVNVEEEE
jgi:hypothetical protein